MVHPWVMRGTHCYTPVGHEGHPKVYPGGYEGHPKVYPGGRERCTLLYPGGRERCTLLYTRGWEEPGIYTTLGMGDPVYPWVHPVYSCTSVSTTATHWVQQRDSDEALGSGGRFTLGEASSLLSKWVIC